MTSLLTWRSCLRGDVGALQVFTCTEFRPPRGLKTWPPPGDHPGWWEYEVQGSIRRLQPRGPVSRFVRLGFDHEGLAAVSVWQELDGPAEVEWQLGAVAARLRHKGGGYADELCRDTFDELTAHALEAGVNSVKITGRVWEENRASQTMCRRHGLRHVNNTKMPGVQVWHRELPVGHISD